MKPQRGYYSLIQFCPDASRLEAVNIGVALFCPALEYLSARTTSSNQRAEKLVGRGKLEKAALNAAKKAIEARLEVDRESLQDLEDLERFVSTRANWLQMTSPRSIKVHEPQADLETLFAELVGGTSLRKAKADNAATFPALRDTFLKLQSEGRATLDLTVKVPVAENTLRVPFAYQNGQLNLIKTQRFRRTKDAAMPTAIRLSIEGDLIRKHGANLDGKPAQLIVVPAFEENAAVDLQERIYSLFHEYHIQIVTPDKMPEFLAQVEREAH